MANGKAVCPPGPKLFKHRTKPCGIRVPRPKAYTRGKRNQTGEKDGFDFPTTLVGSTADKRVSVWVDPSLGADASANALDVLGWSDQIMQWHDALFGYKGSAVNVIVCGLSSGQDGTGGAYHYGCDFSTGADLYVDACRGNSGVVAGLFAAELSEAFMGPNAGQTQPNPWGCGFSTGEGLSRVCANETCALVGSPGALDSLGYGAASSWNVNNDWISKTEQTDQDYDSAGASMVAIDWLRANGYALYKVAQAPCDTLEMCYNSLTGKSSFYNTLVGAVRSLPGGVQQDYPFTGGPNPSGALPSGGNGGGSPPPPPPGNGNLTASGWLGTEGSGVPIELTGTVTVPGSGLGALDPLAVLLAVAKLLSDIRAGNLAAIPADLEALAAALGVMYEPK